MRKEGEILWLKKMLRRLDLVNRIIIEIILLR
jgi:hypothetical protein